MSEHRPIEEIRADLDAALEDGDAPESRIVFLTEELAEAETAARPDYRLLAREHIAGRIRDLEPQTTLDDIAAIVAPLLEAADQVIVAWAYRHNGVWQPELLRRAERLRDELATWRPKA